MFQNVPSEDRKRKLHLFADIVKKRDNEDTLRNYFTLEFTGQFHHHNLHYFTPKSMEI